MAIRIYLKSVALMLIATAAGKILMSFGAAKVLDVASPLFSDISIRQLLLMTASLEMAVAVLLLSGWGGQRLAVAAVAWLGTIFLGYRLMLFASGFHGYCDCLGSLSGAVRFTPAEADRFAVGILIYLLVGSYGILVRWLTYGHRQSLPGNCRTPDSEVYGLVAPTDGTSREASPK